MPGCQGSKDAKDAAKAGRANHAALDAQTAPLPRALDLSTLPPQVAARLGRGPSSNPDRRVARRRWAASISSPDAEGRPERRTSSCGQGPASSEPRVDPRTGASPRRPSPVATRGRSRSARRADDRREATVAAAAGSARTRA